MRDTGVTTPMELTPENPLWDVYIKFHLGEFDDQPSLRSQAKSLLFHIHYGNWDTSQARLEIERRRKGIPLT